MKTSSYFQSQLLNAQAIPVKSDHNLKIQIFGVSGKTNFLNIDGKCLDAIELALIEYANRKDIQDEADDKLLADLGV